MRLEKISQSRMIYKLRNSNYKIVCKVQMIRCKLSSVHEINFDMKSMLSRGNMRNWCGKHSHWETGKVLRHKIYESGNLPVAGTGNRDVPNHESLIVLKVKCYCFVCAMCEQ